MFPAPAILWARPSVAAPPKFVDRARSAMPSSRHVLVVEDDETNRDVALLMLLRLGHRSDVAGNGIEAVSAVRHRAYDIVLMDIQMPEMDGMEATRRIRTELTSVEQPTIIAMTASSTPQDRRECIRTGMDDFLAKPIHFEDLASTLSTWGPQSFAGEDGGRTGRGLEHPVGGPVTFDVDTFDALVADLGGDGSTARGHLLDTFLTGSERTLDRLAEAGRTGDGPSLRAVAHDLGSSGALLGLTALAAAATACGADHRAGSDPVGVRRRADGLAGEYRRALSAVRAQLDAGRDG